MIEIVILMAIAGFVNYIFNLTLLGRRTHRILYVLIIPLVLFLAHFWSIGNNFKQVEEILQSHNLLTFYHTYP